jgi:hypothetical protein
MNLRRVVAVVLALGLVVGAAIMAAWATSAGPFADKERTTLKVMTFNIFYGGDDYDLSTGDFCATSNGCPATFDKVVAAIRSSGADIVGLEEGEGNTKKVADRLGWYASPRTQIVSRYPLLDPPDSDGTYVLVEVEPGKVVAMSSIHLPSTPYGPYAVRDGASAEKVLALEEKTRVPALTARLQALGDVVKAGMPVFLVGDFNSPSPLDWTDAAAAQRKEVPYPLAWPAGALAAKAGFRDSYREAYPDPVAKPGFTWTPGGPEDVKNEVHDRIDWVLVAGPAETVTSEIMGEKAYIDTDIAVDPFPSDHRGLVSTFEVSPVEPPAVISLAERRAEVGDSLAVRSYLPEGTEARVGLIPRFTGATQGDQFFASRETFDGSSRTEQLGPLGSLRPGPYEAVLMSPDATILARTPVWLYAQGASTTVTAAKSTIAPGEPVTVHFGNAPGNRWDWIGLFKATDKDVATDGSIPDDSGNYLLYVYTGTEIEGDATFSKDAFTGSGKWPLPPGRYEARVMVDDGYQTIARSAPFEITG